MNARVASFRISSWAIKQPLIPVIFFLALLLAGLVAYHKLPVNQMPNVQIPTASVSISLPGAAPKELESQVTRRVEAALSNVGNIKHIRSYIADGVSNTEVEFHLGTDINQAMAAIRDQVVSIRPLLPQGIQEPSVQKIEADYKPLMSYSINSEKASLEQSAWFLDNAVMHSLMAIKGIAKIQPQGTVTREFQIELDPAKLRNYGLSIDMVNSQVQQNVLDLPAGKLQASDHEALIRVASANLSLDYLAHLRIALTDGRYVSLHDLGSVRDGSSQSKQLVRLNQQPVVGFAIYRAASASDIEVEDAVKQALRKIHQAHPEFNFSLVQSQVDYTRESHHSVLWAFIEGILLASAVVFLFLRTWQATWVCALVIPLSAIPTFLVMQWLHFSLNLVSMLALSLVAGILVDDTIVEIENINRHMRMGKTPYQAAIDAADEIGLAVVATAFTVIAVFIPVSFMGGAVGQYFIQFGITVAIATFFSLLVARLCTPVLAAYFFKAEAHNRPVSTWQSGLLQRYQTWLGATLVRRKFTVLVGLVILLLSLAIAVYLPTGFMPFEDKSQSMLQVELPPGARLADTDSSVKSLTQLLLKRPEVSSVYAVIGGSDSESNIDGQVRRASLSIQLKPRRERKLDVRRFEEAMQVQFANIPNIRASFVNENGSKALSIGLASDNPALLQATANQLEREMRGLDVLSKVSSTRPLPQTELSITPRNQDVARLGVSADSMADIVRIATMGDNDANLSKLHIDERLLPIRVTLAEGSKNDSHSLSQLLLPSSDGSLVPLSAVADIRLSAGETSINRLDRERLVTLEADLNNNATLGQALDAIDKLPTMRHLPAGVSRNDTGDVELLAEMFDSFSIAMVAGVFAIYAVLVMLFRTLLQPVTIMFALPLSFSGALLALLLTGTALSLPSVIGILMLMGIVAKNGILLVDFIIEQRHAGLSRHQAIMQACQQRANPIIMTTLAMIAGMLPVILGVGAGTEFRVPMALTVIGGLVTSTALSLLFIPVLYSLVDDFEVWLKPKLLRFTSLESH
jgi:hydrophobic/amphiphilic exporter-1 (mainly G- bacteria), HAE1 family